MTSVHTARQQEAAQELLLRRAARTNLMAFTTYTFKGFKPSWHHELTAHFLERAFRTANSTLLPDEEPLHRLMVFQPPRHGKSEQISIRFPAWCYGQDPQLQFIHASYAYELSATFSAACRNTIKSEEYQNLWPTKIAKDSDHIWQIAGKKNQRPSWISAGVGGGISGQGAHLLLIDDPLKNQQEADSLTIRDGNWSWYLSTARSRLELPGVVVLVMTRWHENDLAGRLIEQAKSDPAADQWVILELPAVNTKEEGQTARIWRTDSLEEEKLPPYKALWPAKYTHVWMAGTKATSGPRVWNALYQQRPRAVEGNIVKMKWYRFWQHAGNNLPPVQMSDGVDAWEVAPVTLPTMDELLQSWDMAFKDTKDSAFVVGQVWGRHNANMFLLNQIRERLSFTASQDGVRQLSAQYPEAYQKLVEDKANGSAIIDSLNNEIGGFIAIEPNGDKKSRLEAGSVSFKSGNVYLPHPSLAPWVWSLINELCGAPFGEFWDQCDATSQAINHMQTTGGGFLAFLKSTAEARKEAEREQQKQDALDTLKLEGQLTPSDNEVNAKMLAMWGLNA